MVARDLVTIHLPDKAEMRARAHERGMTISAALREGARLYLTADAIPRCPTCEGRADPPFLPETDDAFGHWLAGFIDGEGCFKITRISRSVTYRCQFSLGVRVDDLATLEAVRDRLGFGSIYRFPGRRESNTRASARWDIINKRDGRALVDLLDRFPLRSKKARDYAIWREAMLLWWTYRGNRWHRDGPWDRIAELKAELERARRFCEP
jgi:hypothetical protein